MFFGIPDHKDACGSGAYAEDGIVQKAFREAKKQFPDLYCIGDVCMCEYTSHGHCGILHGEYVDNDKTLELSGENRPVPGAGRCGYGSAFRYDGRACGGYPVYPG